MEGAPVMDGAVHTFQIALIGNIRVGKSAFIKTSIAGSFEDRNTVIANEQGEFEFQIATKSNGVVRFVVSEHRTGSVLNESIDGLLFVFDVSNAPSHEALYRMYMDYVSFADKEIIVMGAKCDTKPTFSPSFATKKTLPYCESSAKKMINMRKPFLWFARKLMKQPSLEFV